MAVGVGRARNYFGKMAPYITITSKYPSLCIALRKENYLYIHLTLLNQYILYYNNVRVDLYDLLLPQGVISADDILHVTFRMLMKYTFGASVAEDELAELGELRKLTASLIADTFSNPLVQVPFYKYLPTDTNRRLAEFKRRWKAFIDRYRKISVWIGF